MAYARRWIWLQAILTFSLLSPSHGQLNESFHYTDLTQAFPLVFTSPLRHSPSYGGQNFTQCCVKAVSESYSIQNGKIVLNPNNYVLGLSPNEFNTSKFPCGASYDGNAAGAPEVVIPYSWCNQNCGGWQKSANAPLTQWVQPFVGFILPAAVFCLNVPRQSTAIGVSDQLFGDHFKDLPAKWLALKNGSEAIREKSDFLRHIIWEVIKGLITRKEFQHRRQESGSSFVEDLMRVLSPGVYLFAAFVMMVIKACIAASVALFNTVVWVGTVFSLAGPMILSGLVEATIDRKLISKMLAELSSEDADKRNEAVPGDGKEVPPKDPNLFYKRIHQLYVILVGNLTLDPDKDVYLEDRTVWKDVELLTSEKSDIQIGGSGVDPDNNHFKLVTDTRLKAMLDCQSSFGAAVGAPVVFFVGSFLFSVISNFGTLGDNDTSHSLAFGEWWMIIPHVAIVSGCLLAGNNPNTLQVIVSSLTGPWREKPEYDDRGELITRKPSGYKLGKAYYNSVYTPVWMWERGRSKRRWVAEVTKIYPRKSKHEGSYFAEAWINSRDWAVIVAITLVLMIFPFTLAFLTSYFTPTVGMSCRTFTFLLYFLFQLVLGVLWIIDFFANQTPAARNRHPRMSLLFSVLWGFTVLGSVFTAVVGTFLQILGVYRNCLCDLPMNAWRSRNFNIVISSNSANDIKYATKFWVPTGVTSIVLMIVTCYIGWWYQRHWRIQFRTVVDKLLAVPPPPMEIRAVTKAKSSDDDAGGVADDINPAAHLFPDSAVDEKPPKQPVVVDEKELPEDKTKQDEEGKKEEHPEDKIEENPEVKG